MIYKPAYRLLVPDLKGHLNQLLQDEQNEGKKINIQAFISALESGEEIGPDELFCKGKKMKMQDWNPQLGYFFKFPVVSGAQVLAT